MLIPKPFIPESELESDEQRIFVPKQPSVIDGLHYCACVHVCKQFMDYPVDIWGRRIIPHDAKCPMMETNGDAPYCIGRFVSVNGRILRATSDYPEPCLVYEHQKTR